MKKNNLLKTEIIDKIYNNKLSKKQLLLIDSCVNNILCDINLGKVTKFEDYLSMLNYDNILDNVYIFDYKNCSPIEVWDSFKNFKHIIIKSYIVERFGLTNDIILSTLQKVLTSKGSPKNIMNYKVIILEE